MKFTNITVMRNNKIIATKEKGIWLTLEPSSGLLYLYYDLGRIYFLLQNVNQECMGILISDVGYDEKKQLIRFRYQGRFECDDKDEDVDFEYEIIFGSKKDFDRAAKIIDCCTNKPAIPFVRKEKFIRSKNFFY